MSLAPVLDQVPDDVPDITEFAIEPDRCSRAKRAYTTRRVDLHGAARLLAGDVKAKPVTLFSHR